MNHLVHLVEPLKYLGGSGPGPDPSGSGPGAQMNDLGLGQAQTHLMGLVQTQMCHQGTALGLGPANC